uniref:Uncharacterized protein n=1 Tax=Anopheles atroparvus TaxID=41427 RepID=A0A182IWN7_ANOAO
MVTFSYSPAATGSTRAADGFSTAAGTSSSTTFVSGGGGLKVNRLEQIENLSTTVEMVLAVSSDSEIKSLMSSTANRLLYVSGSGGGTNGSGGAHTGGGPCLLGGPPASPAPPGCPLGCCWSAVDCFRLLSFLGGTGGGGGGAPFRSGSSPPPPPPPLLPPPPPPIPLATPLPTTLDALDSGHPGHAHPVDLEYLIALAQMSPAGLNTRRRTIFRARLYEEALDFLVALRATLELEPETEPLPRSPSVHGCLHRCVVSVHLPARAAGGLAALTAYRNRDSFRPRLKIGRSSAAPIPNVPVVAHVTVDCTICQHCGSGSAEAPQQQLCNRRSNRMRHAIRCLLKRTGSCCRQ